MLTCSKLALTTLQRNRRAVNLIMNPQSLRRDQFPRIKKGELQAEPSTPRCLRRLAGLHYYSPPHLLPCILGNGSGWLLKYITNLPNNRQWNCRTVCFITKGFYIFYILDLDTISLSKRRVRDGSESQSDSKRLQEKTGQYHCKIC